MQPAEPFTASELRAALDQGRRSFRGITVISVDGAQPDLAGVDLAGTDFTGADLTGADLRCTTLFGASFVGASLTGVDLRGANRRFRARVVVRPAVTVRKVTELARLWCGIDLVGTRHDAVLPLQRGLRAQLVDDLVDAYRRGEPLAPIAVRLTVDGRYAVQDGHHRYVAALRAGVVPELRLDPERPRLPVLHTDWRHVTYGRRGFLLDMLPARERATFEQRYGIARGVGSVDDLYLDDASPGTPVLDALLRSAAVVEPVAPVDLAAADLRDAMFTGADLRAAIVSGTRFDALSAEALVALPPAVAAVVAGRVVARGSAAEVGLR